MTPLRLGILTEKALPMFMEETLARAEQEGWLTFTLIHQASPPSFLARVNEFVYEKYLQLELVILESRKPAPQRPFAARAALDPAGLGLAKWDVLLNLSPGASCEWTAAHGCWDFGASALSAFWDVFHGRTVSVCELCADGKPIRRAVINVDPNSVVRHQWHVESKNVNLLMQALRILHSQGEIHEIPAGPPLQLRTSRPRLFHVLWRFFQVFGRKIKKRFPGRPRSAKWSLFAAAQEDAPPDWSMFQPIPSPQEVFWADPFPIERDGRRYIFIEEFLYSTRLGRIVCLALDENGNLIHSGTILEKPYHLSYPFLFEYEDELFMIPESGHNDTVDLYRCADFPYQWEHVKTIMNGVAAFDATLLEHDEKWWMFVNLKEEGGSSWDTLHLFYTDDPIHGEWTPHPLNPIVQDVRSARSAGRIFKRGEALIRPSQDSSLRYGYATNFNRILRLSETEYEEERAYTFKPPPGSGILATHTWNSIKGLTVIDAVVSGNDSSLQTVEIEQP